MLLFAFSFFASTQAFADYIFLRPDKTVVSVHSEPLLRLLDGEFCVAAVQHDSLEDVSVAGAGQVTHPGLRVV